MKSFLTNENNDIYLDGARSLAIGEGIDAVAQVVQNVVNTLKGEIQLNTELGIPYFETLFNKQSPDVSVWESYMIEEISKIDGVVRVESFVSKITDNKLTYEATIQTIYGVTTIEG